VPFGVELVEAGAVAQEEELRWRAGRRGRHAPRRGRGRGSEGVVGGREGGRGRSGRGRCGGIWCGAGTAGNGRADPEITRVNLLPFIGAVTHLRNIRPRTTQSIPCHPVTPADYLSQHAP
jgi:hypothetical protein